MTPEQLVDRLRLVLGDELRSVIVFGSKVAGDFVESVSGVDILAVADRFDVTTLKALSEPVNLWINAGNPPPLLATAEEVKASADAFAIEWLDMQQSRRVLYGVDVLAELDVKPEILRLQVESQLKGRLLTLRKHYLATRARTRQVAALMTDSVGTFLVLLRAALRLYEQQVPARKIDALAALAKHIPFDTEPFSEILALKQRHVRLRDVDVERTFSGYLSSIETVVSAVDRHIHTAK